MINNNTCCFNFNKKYSKFLSWILKDDARLLSGANCRGFRAKTQSFSHTLQEDEDEYPNSDDFDDELEVSEIITRYMEAKAKRMTIGTSPSTNFRLKHLIFPLGGKGCGDTINDESAEAEVEAEEERFLTPRSRLSRCSSACSSLETFVSAKETLFSTRSCTTTWSSIDLMDMERRNLMIRQLRDCEGWPFGLCKKALMLPPLPKSPSDSWLWCNKSAAKTTISAL